MPCVQVELSSRNCYNPYNQAGSQYTFTSDVDSLYSACVPPRHRKHFEVASPTTSECFSCSSCSACSTSSVSLPSFAQLVADLPPCYSPTAPQIPSTSLGFYSLPPYLYYQTGLAQAASAPTCSQCHNVSPPEPRLDTRACPSPVTREPELLMPQAARLAKTKSSTPKAGTSGVSAKRRRSRHRAWEPWMTNVVDLGPNDHGVVTYQCLNQHPDGRVCGYEARPSTVERHCLSVHLRLRPHVCDRLRKGSNGKIEQCNQGFAQKSSLRIHIQTVHTREKPENCHVPGCTRTFSDPARRSHHITHDHSAAERETYMRERKIAPFENCRQRSDTIKAFPAPRRASKKRRGCANV